MGYAGLRVPLEVLDQHAAVVDVVVLQADQRENCETKIGCG
jgi:hypothetical protein